MTTGYSDRLNHALAFAAKHHDSQVRKGLRLPYGTLPANVALILTRYGQDDETVLAGILHDLVATYVRDEASDDPALDRIAAKFGAEVLALALAVAPRGVDDDGIQLDAGDRRLDLLRRLGEVDERARWVSSAVQLHDAGTLLADLARTEFPENVWERLTAGRDETVRWFRQFHDRLRAVGFSGPILQEIGTTVTRLEAVAAEDAARAEF